MEPATDFSIPRAGPCQFDSPLALSTVRGDLVADFTPDDSKIAWDISGKTPGVAFESAGPRQRVFFDGARSTAGIVTCGGLCPGMNNIIRGLVLQLWHTYGIRRIHGFRYGYLGLTSEAPKRPKPLDPEVVSDIHHEGGTVLGSSRGHRAVEEIADTLVHTGTDLLFCVGGDGTMRGAEALFEEVKARRVPRVIVGIPKTIDNDLPYVERTFGFDTAVSIAAQAIRAAHVEARGAPDGVGIVRLMGRQSGHLAANAALASGEANLVLVPEVPFDLDGPRGVMAWARRRLEDRGHVVLVVAEGAGQEHVECALPADASGNPRFGDIGLLLRDRMRLELGPLGASVKYIDPGYIIRAAPANAADSVFCGQLAEDAVHAAMSGRTGMLVGYWAGRFTHVPLAAVNAVHKRLDVDGPLWRNVVERTGQPALLRNDL